MSRDDHTNDSIPEPQAASTEAEERQAAAFAELVDGMLKGDAAPPALDTDERELLVVATSVHASTANIALDEKRRDALIDRAFAQGLHLSTTHSTTTKQRDDEEANAVVSLAEHRRSLRRAIPWGIAAVATAAALLLAFMRTPLLGSDATHRVKTIVIERPLLSVAHTSRPADALIGKIDKKDAHRASDRIDLIMADRMAGYRDLYLRGLTRMTAKPGGVK